MESPPNANVQEGVNTESPEVVTDCLQTPVILRKILEHVPSTELFRQLSFVNKLWNHEARSILRDRGCLVAKFFSLHPCQDLAAFASDLRSMNVVPYAGIVLFLLPQCDVSGGCAGPPPASELDPSYDEALGRLRWRFLFVCTPYNNPGGYNKNCLAFLLVKKILQDFGAILDTLDLALDLNRGDFFEQVLQDCKFSRLKELRLGDQNGTTSNEYKSFVKGLVSLAPSLQELYVTGRVDLTANLLKGSSALLFPLYDVAPTVDEIPENIRSALRMKRMKLFIIREDVSLESINMTTSILLQASRTTLTSVQLHAPFLAPLMCYGISLDNVVDLSVYISPVRPLRPRIFRLMKEFDFTRIFPSLTRVDCFVVSRENTSLQNQIIQMIDQCYPDLTEPVADRAVNITHLRLYFHENAEDCELGLVPEWLPHVETLLVSAYKGDVMPSFLGQQCWANLKDLEVVKIGRNSSRNANLDSIFCGLFPEEVAELREKDDEYLNAVNIVPVMPSFVCLKGLRNFTFSGDSGCLSRRGDDSITDVVPPEMLSRVTGLLAFKRSPGLIVTLKTDDAETKRELDHMQPYANVLLRPPVIGLH